MIHLICGSTGVGKTTYARQLAQERQAILFSIDEWMKNLFWPDAAESPSLDWALARVERCETQIWALCRQLLANGQEVILDLGLSKAAHRQKFRELAQAAAIPVTLHYLTADKEVRYRRVNRRNEGQGETYTIDVSRKMFDFMESWFEPPSGEELAGALIVET